MPPAKVDTDAVRQLWRTGLTDTAIAARLGWDRETVRKNRRLAGLPVRFSPRELIARYADELKRCRNEANAARRAALASRYGLPADLRPVQVAVVVLLAAGPLTAAQLADLCGRTWRVCHRTHYHRFQCPTVGGGNYLTELRRRGLVTLLPTRRRTGNGSGRGESLYLLTALAMDLLLTRKEAAR